MPSELSAPHLLRAGLHLVDVRSTLTTVEIFHQGQWIASSELRSRARGQKERGFCRRCAVVA
jgi:hypothetical protein